MRINIEPFCMGGFLVRGDGLGDWSQPPTWPCSEEVFRQRAHSTASEEFIRAAMKVAAGDPSVEVMDGDVKEE